MINEIKYILSKFSKDDLNFLNESCIFYKALFRHVKKLDDIPIGFVEAAIFRGNLYINIGVVPEHRRKGIAFELMDTLINWFTTTKYRSLIWKVDKDNLPSIEFVKKYGFTEFQHIRNHESNRYFALGNRLE